MMKLVEVIRALQTDDEVYALIDETARKVGKTPVEVNDSPGFVSNRFWCQCSTRRSLHCMKAWRQLGDRQCDEAGHGPPDGPAGIGRHDRTGHLPLIMEVLHEGLGDPNTVPAHCCARWSTPGSSAASPGNGAFSTTDP